MSSSILLNDKRSTMATTVRDKLVPSVILAIIAIAIMWSFSNLYKKVHDMDTQIVLLSEERNKENYSKYVCGHHMYNISEWRPPVLLERLQNADHKNADLAKNICDNWIIPPFPGERQLETPETVHYSQRGQSQYIDDLLKQKTDGFYIECGAGNGESLSNSLFFEKDRNWSGLLIEANPENFKGILQRRRHAYALNACLSPRTTPAFLNFTLANVIGGLTDLIEPSHKTRIKQETNNSAQQTKIQCFPLVSILRAMNVSHIDYFSLDIEGAEMEILKTFPFDEIRVDVLTVEYAVSSDQASSTKKYSDIKNLMVDKFGYQVTSYQGVEDIMLAKNV